MSCHTPTCQKEAISFMSSITQDMRYRQALMKYAAKYGVSRVSRKYNKNRSYIYFWQARWDGSVKSLGCRSRRPHSHPNQHTEAELKLDPGHAPPESDAGLGRTVAPVEAKGLYPPSGKSISGYAKTGDVSCGESKECVQTQAL